MRPAQRLARRLVLETTQQCPFGRPIRHLERWVFHAAEAGQLKRSADGTPLDEPDSPET